jgi:hypothetical protein
VWVRQRSNGIRTPQLASCSGLYVFIEEMPSISKRSRSGSASSDNQPRGRGLRKKTATEKARNSITQKRQHITHTPSQSSEAPIQQADDSTQYDSSKSPGEAASVEDEEVAIEREENEYDDIIECDSEGNEKQRSGKKRVNMNGKKAGTGERTVAQVEEESDESELGEFKSIRSLLYLIITLTERLKKSWTAPIYGFYKADVKIGYDEGRKYHLFRCDGRSCTETIRRYLDTKDRSSTSNLRKHARTCWGKDAVKVVDDAKNADEVRNKHVKALKQHGTITAAFERTGKGKVTYSHTQHTPIETRYT